MPELTQIQSTFLTILQSSLANTTASLLSETDTTAILRLASEHKLQYMLLSAIPAEILPNPQSRRSTLLQHVASQVASANAFLTLLSELEQAGFHPTIVKGIVCRSLYPQPELRPSSDEDLYVSDVEFEPCCAFLQNRGMKPDKTPFSDYGEIGWRDANGLYIELHRDLFEGDAFSDLREFFDFGTLPKESYATPYGESVVSMNPHDHFLYLLLHAYKYFIHSGFGIRQVCDIGLWGQKFKDRINWQKLCTAVKILSFTKAVLGIARHDLKIELELPDDWKTTQEYSRPMLCDILNGGIYGSADTNRQHSATMTLNAVKTSQTDAKYSVWLSVFPKREAMESKYPYVKKHPLLLPVAWGHRLFTYAKRNRAGKTKAAESVAIGKVRIELLRFYDIVE